VRQAADIVRGGGLIAYPTDSCYALAAASGCESARRLPASARDGREAPPDADVPGSLGESPRYAIVDNVQYRLLKAATPGAYTFILRATREVPRRLLHSAPQDHRGARPDHVVAHALLAELGQPMLSATLALPGAAIPPSARGNPRLRWSTTSIW
jgi:tRNA A37 threonylcarbamoyladenosine synthetase subunit TsaC/SUA5/YrdC